MLYFLGWLIASGVKASGPSYLVFLTNWAFITFSFYLIVAAISTTTKYLSVHLLWPAEGDSFSRANDFVIEKPQGCCGYKNNNITWYQMIHWVLFTLATDLAVGVMLLYWTLLYDSDMDTVDGVNANTHLINGLIALLEIWISGVPVNFVHFLYAIIFGVIYSIFTGVYYVISDDLIYDGVLDYDSAVGRAVGAIFGVVFVLIPLVHIVLFYLQHLAKFWIFYFIFRKERAQVRDPEKTELSAV